MISEAEIRRLAPRLGVDLTIVDLDYALGCFLASLYRQPGAIALAFKGGTCLRKCYYADYRFSVDLDFTLVQRRTREDLRQVIEGAQNAAADDWEIDFLARPMTIEVVDDEYGMESYHARLYYRGPLRMRGDPRAIRLDVTTKEAIAFPLVERPLIHPYSDAAILSASAGHPAVRVAAYDLMEILAEKFRALVGQRTYAISRDVYDLHELTARHDFDLGELATALPTKLAAKDMAMADVDVEAIARREQEFRSDWDRNLVHLLPPGSRSDFDLAWLSTLRLLKSVTAQ